MAQPGDEITYTFSGAKETEDISDVDEVRIVEMEGAGGGGGRSKTSARGPVAGGNGGRIVGARIEVSANGQLEIFVGEAGANGFNNDNNGGFGRFNGGAGGNGLNNEAGDGGGSTELLVDGGFRAAADAGGGGGAGTDTSDDRCMGGGGARGGFSSTNADSDFRRDGQEGGGQRGFGGLGAGISSSGGKPGGDGGQEVASVVELPGFNTETGGGFSGDGEITLAFDIPAAPTSLTVNEDLTNVKPTVDLAWTNTKANRFNRIFRAVAGSASFPNDFIEVGTASKGTEKFTDSPPDFETSFTYRVTATADGGESDPSAPATITTSAGGELVVTITNTNSPVTLGDTLEFDVDVENVGDYRADEIIDADLELQ